MKIVYSYDDEGESPRLAKLHGRKFKSYDQIISLLKSGDTVTVESNLGYKQVGIDKNSRGWIQRNFSPEY